MIETIEVCCPAWICLASCLLVRAGYVLSTPIERLAPCRLTQASYRSSIVLITFLLLTGRQVYSAVVEKPDRVRQEKIADTVFFGGRVLSFTEAYQQASSIAVRGSTIIAVGSDTELKKYIGEKTRLVPLRGRLLAPGLIDSHGHLLGFARQQQSLNLRTSRSLAEAKSMIKKELGLLAAGRWLVGRGWDQNLWPERLFPGKKDLDELTTKHPIYLTRVDGHAAWVNSLALKMAGIKPGTKSPSGGRIMRLSSGEASGILIDQAMRLVANLIPKGKRIEDLATLKRAVSSLHRLGITGFHDAGVSRYEIGLYRDLLASKDLKLRSYLMLALDFDLLGEHLAGPPLLAARDGFLTIRAIKVMADGALGSRGAALSEAYQDEPSHRGHLLVNPDDLRKLTTKALQRGWQVASHAIGDRAARMVIDAYEQALHKTKVKGKLARLRIEHSQLVAPDDQKRMAKLGLVASMQPIHCSSDGPWLDSRLGKQRRDRLAFPWRSLLNLGVPLAFGSDTPVESPDPIPALWAAVTRRSLGQRDRGQIWNVKEALNMREALYAMTKGAAYAEFAETIRGDIAPGFLADLAVFSQDLLELKDYDDILATKVDMTFVGGDLVFER